MSEKDVLITSKDLFSIKSVAVSEYGRLPNPTLLTNIPVEQKDLAHIALINSFVMWLNSRNLLTTLVRFDHTDDTSNFEGEE